MGKEIYVYYKRSDYNFDVVYFDDTFKTLVKLPDIKKYKGFECFKGYDQTEESLRKYKADLIKWSDELKSNDFFKFDYLSCTSHFGATEIIFNILKKCDIKTHDKICIKEHKWIEKCHNGGLTFCNKGEHQSYGYDFKAFYPSIQCDSKLLIPTKEGKESILEKLPDKLQLGFYRVNIISDHKDVKKIFSFSKQSVYTNTSLDYARSHQEEFDFSIELIQDGEPNAYLYSDYIKGSDIFGKWFYILFKLKKMFPKNKLIKHLLSSNWGTLQKKNIKRYTAEEIKEKDLKISRRYTARYQIINHNSINDQDYYELQDLENLYVHNIRLKSFLTSLGRTRIADVALTDINNVIRIQTDGIVFNKEQDLKQLNYAFPLLDKEDKTTGLINWININDKDMISDL